MTDWKVGFYKQIITPEDYKRVTYYIAGYNRNCPAREVMDDIYVRAFMLNAGAETVAFAVVDCIGMSYRDVCEIRAEMKDWQKRQNVSHINIAFTHVHDAPDTQGLWGKGLRTGRNKNYMRRLKFFIKKSLIEAEKNMKPGKLFFGSVLTENMILDNRLPEVHDDHLYRFRFVPADGSAELYIIQFSCHPELMGKNRYTISADFPCYMGRTIHEKTGAEFVFINGMIGEITCYGMNEVYRGKYNGKEKLVAFGKKLGEYALSVAEERELPAVLMQHAEPTEIPAENKIFRIARLLGIINTPVLRVKNRPYKYQVISEVGYLLLGDVKAALIPGELFPELALGGFFSAEESSVGKEFSRQTLFEIMGEGDKLVFGLMNDEIGYIIPENDFMLDERMPYSFFRIPFDKFGRQHYAETTCSGPYAAKAVFDSIQKLCKTVKS